MKRSIEIWMAVLLVLATILVGAWSVKTVSSKQILEKKKVLIDAGHGGVDPGKVSKSGVLEKDVNLQIAIRLGKYLKKQGLEVYYTRQQDEGLYDPNSKRKKAEDLQKRCQIVENVKPDIMISIHQNSFEDTSVKGAQVFYFSTSKESQRLGECVQQGLIDQVNNKNHRKSKANDSYYILKKTACPTIIVECGFLSNPEECKKLQEEGYQSKIVEGIYQGIILYFEK